MTLTVTDAEGLSDAAQRAVVVDGEDRTGASLAPFGAAVSSLAVRAPELLLRAAPRRPLWHGRLRYVVRCRNTDACRGTLRAIALVGPDRHPVLLAVRRFRVAAGGPRILHLRLGRVARRRLAGRTHVRVTAYSGRVRVAATWAVQNYTLKLPRRHRGG